jgi:hypothetical protein
MKIGIALILFLLLVGFANAGMPVAHKTLHEAGAVIQFESMVHDYGTMREGDIKECVFKFTNKGDAPLIIQNVEEPCGCTVPFWSKEPVMPGQTGEIKVVFHSKERPGVFRKTLAVKTNAVLKNHEEILLMIKGNVLTKKEWKKAGGTTKELNSKK